MDLAHLVLSLALGSSVLLGWGKVAPDGYRAHIEGGQSCAHYGWKPREGARGIVVDALLFHGELDILEARLHELHEWVDLFVIAEPRHFFWGGPRKPAFAACLADPSCQPRFSAFLDKVIYSVPDGLQACVGGDAAACESEQWEALSVVVERVGGYGAAAVTVTHAGEFLHGSAAWALAACEAPEMLKVHARLFYFSAHCYAEQQSAHFKVVSGTVVEAAGLRAVREAGEDWAIMIDGGYHFSNFMTPEEMAAAERGRYAVLGGEAPHPFPTAAWHLENARSCIHDPGRSHAHAVYVPTSALMYPLVPWYAVENPNAMWRFFAYEQDEDATIHINPNNGGNSVAVCVTGQLRGSVHWSDVSAVHRVVEPGSVDIFAVVTEEDCATAEAHLGVRHPHGAFVRCIPDSPLTPHELRFVEEGPNVDFIEQDHRRAHVLQYRLLHACGELLRERVAFTSRPYAWVLRKRADVLLRTFPALHSLEEMALYTAYRDKDQHLGGLNDKVFLGRPSEMSHVFDFYSFMLEPTNWPALRMICATSTFGRTMSRFFVRGLTHVAGPAESILQSFLMARGVAVRAHARLLYDKPFGSLPECSSAETLAGPTGVFAATLNPDNHSNAYPRDPYIVAPLLNVLLHDQKMSAKLLVVADCGCGTGYLVKEMLAWNLKAFGIDGNEEFWAVLGKGFGLQAELTEGFDQEASIQHLAGMMRGSGGPLINENWKVADWTLNIDPEEKVGLPDWTVSIDVGSFIPPPSLSTFIQNLVDYAERGVVLRWGSGPHQMAWDHMDTVFARMGFERDAIMERPFAMIAGLVGPERGDVRVYVRSEVLPGGVLGLFLDEGASEPPSMEHVMASILQSSDLFEPNREASHFSPEEEVWPLGEVEVVASYVRFWRAYLRPRDADKIFAPLHLLALRAPTEEYAWGAVTWNVLVDASWDVTEILVLLFDQNETGPISRLVTLSQVEWLQQQRLVRRHGHLCRGCIFGAAGDARSIFSSSVPNRLTAGHSLAMAVGPKHLRPWGLHRQTWLHRLASRFDTG